MLKTEIWLEVHFRRETVLRRIFYFFQHRKKTKLTINIQLTNLHNRMAVGSKIFFHVELWAKNTNPHNCHTRFEISNKKFLRETLYNTKNTPGIF